MKSQKMYKDLRKKMSVPENGENGAQNVSN